MVIRFRKTWSVTYIYHTNSRYPFGTNPKPDSLKTEDITSRIDVDTFFSELVRHNMFSLANRKIQAEGSVSYSPTTGEWGGGGMGTSAHYCPAIEFSIGPYSRSYRYCDPDTYSRFYATDHDLADFVAIERMFNELIKY